MNEATERWLTFAREDLRVAEGESEAEEALRLAQLLLARVDADA